MKFSTIDTIIASIDAGQSTGYAIARLQIDARRVLLRKKALGTTMLLQEVLDAIETNECSNIVIENKASNGSTAGTEPFDYMMQGLFNLGFTKEQGFYLVFRRINTVSPGIWKPFMKATSMDRGKWSPATSHESDAMKMLYYIVKTNHMNKEVRYA